MKKEAMLLIVFCCILLTGCVPEQVNQNEEIITVKDDFIVGGALNPLLFMNESLAPCLDTADEIFDTVVDESMFKWNRVEREKGKIDFSYHKKTTHWAKEHDKKIRHHTLFWSNPEKIPDWAKELSDEELRQAIFDRINYAEEEVGQDIVSLDVVNEMIAFDYFRERLGDEIIKEIYAETRKVFPKAKLYINEHPYHICIANNCSNITTKEEYKDYYIDEFLLFLDYLDKIGVEYDGIGLQAHFTDVEIIKRDDGMRFEMDNKDNIILYDQLINEIYSKTGKKVLITELDFRTHDELKRAEFVKEFYKMALENDNVEGVIYWSWLMSDTKALVDHEECKPNLAGKEILKLR